MVGLHTGLVTRFKEKNPFLLNVHCWLHRIALAHKDVTKDIQYLKDFKELICDLHSYFAKSSVKSKLLRDHQIIWDEDDIRILTMCETRWLSLYRCVLNLQRSITSVLMVLDSDLETSRGKKLKDKSEENKYYTKYERILEEMLTFRFMAFMNFLSDILYSSS